MSGDKMPLDTPKDDHMAATDSEGLTVMVETPSVSAKVARFVRCVAVFWVVGLGAFVTVMGFGEIAARTILYRQPAEVFKNLASPRQWEDRPGLNFEFTFQTGFGIYPTPGWSDANTGDKHDSRGFRGRELTLKKPKGVFRIACLGGSTTYDVKIEDGTKAYPAQLESELCARGLQVEVVNAGMPGWTSREQILNYVTRVSYLDPDMIVYFEPINDLVCRANWPPESLRSDYTTPWITVPDFAKPRWYQSLTLIRVPLILLGHLLPANYGWDTPLKVQGMSNIAWLHRGREAVGPGVLPCTVPQGMTLKELFAAIPTDYFANNIATVACCAKQRNAKVLFVSGILDWKSISSIVADHGEGLRYGVGQMNETMARVAREQNEFYYDLAGEWPEDAPLSYWGDEFHNNEVGAHLKAEMISKYIVKTNLTPPITGL